MGSSNHNSSGYSGKGSTSSVRRSTGSTRSNEREDLRNSSMVEMLQLLEEVERCRENVADKESDLGTAKKELEAAEAKAKAQVNKLDPETKARFKRMMGEIDDKGREPGE